MSPSSAPCQEQKLTWTGWVLRTLLTCCVLSTVYYKFAGSKLPFMLTHCHAVTAVYLYSLYCRDLQHAQRVFNVSIYWLFFTVLALATPDMAGLVLPLERVNFWVHHTLLLAVPLYCLLSGHYRVDATWADLRLAMAIGILYHYLVMLPLALVTSVNVGYMLRPPLGVPMRAGPLGRPIAGCLMMLCSVLVFSAVRYFRPREFKLTQA